METQTKNLIKYLIFPLVLALGLVIYYGQETPKDWLMHVRFYNIGQGDSFLVTTYQGNHILFDGGPGSKVVEEMSRDLSFFDREIEMIVLTHAHSDHYEGLISVLERYHVKKILMPNFQEGSSGYKEFLQAVKNESAEVVYAVQGLRIHLDSATVLDILHPSTKNSEILDKEKDINDTSIVARLIFGKTKLLLTGDAGINIEKQLLPRFNLDSDLLKVGHHGSKHSTSKEFLSEVTPEFSVIQVGKNSYGHPAPVVLENLEAIQSQIYRIDQDHNLEFVSNGDKLWKL